MSTTTQYLHRCDRCGHEAIGKSKAYDITWGRVLRVPEGVDYDDICPACRASLHAWWLDPDEDDD